MTSLTPESNNQSDKQQYHEDAPQRVRKNLHQREDREAAMRAVFGLGRDVFVASFAGEKVTEPMRASDDTSQTKNSGT